LRDERRFVRTAKSCGPYVQDYFSSSTECKKPLLHSHF
jgi:hypothetical protein